MLTGNAGANDKSRGGPGIDAVTELLSDEASGVQACWDWRRLTVGPGISDCGEYARSLHTVAYVASFSSHRATPLSIRALVEREFCRAPYENGLDAAPFTLKLRLTESLWRLNCGSRPAKHASVVLTVLAAAFGLIARMQCRNAGVRSKWAQTGIRISTSIFCQEYGCIS